MRMNLRPTPPATPDDSEDEDPHFRPDEDDGGDERMYIGAVGQVAVADPRNDVMDGGCFLCDTIGDTGTPGANALTEIFDKFMADRNAKSDVRHLAHNLDEAWQKWFYTPSVEDGEPVTLYSEGNFLRHFTENHRSSRTLALIMAFQDMTEI